MSYNPITSFRRPIDAVRMDRIRVAASDAEATPADKWDILRELATARVAFGLSDRALSVLQALLSFHPKRSLEPSGSVVFPSNRSICERLNGMACSTMRRHLAALVESGLINRRDSPNGKRFLRRYRTGDEAFGLDLAPLAARLTDIRAAADALRQEAEELSRLRRDISLMRRDLLALVEYGEEMHPAADWIHLQTLACHVSRALRRNLDRESLERMSANLFDAVQTARSMLGVRAENLSTKVTQIEHHYQRSKKEYLKGRERDSIQQATAIESDNGAVEARKKSCRLIYDVPLPIVLVTCNEIHTYTLDSIRGWGDFINVACTIRPMLGISEDVWSDAVSAMGYKNASVTLALILERFREIRSPGAYLRHLTAKAVSERFSVMAMVKSTARRLSDVHHLRAARHGVSDNLCSQL